LNKVISNAEVIAVDSKLNQVWAATDNNGFLSEQKQRNMA
jgi:hypothetical protein